MEWMLEVVVVPVSDVDRARHFYSEQLGFKVDVDTTVGETFRIVQLTPPGSACSITLGPTPMPPGTLKGMQLCVYDIEAAREKLVAAGVQISPIRHMDDGVWVDGKGAPWNSFMFFDDPDGNSWTVQEKPR